MYATQMQSYSSVYKSTLTGREIEAAALNNAAIKLRDCQINWGQEGHAQRLSDSLRLNQQIWIIFQSELAKPDNPLPLNIRKDILTLSIFISKQIFDIMAYPASEKLDILINININLAAGLRSSPD